MFRSSTFKTLTIEESELGLHGYASIALPPVDKRQKRYNYGLLDPDGIVRIGSSVQKDDIIVAKTLVRSNKGSDGSEEIIDCSYAIKPGEEGIVDRVLTMNTPTGYKLIKVVIRTERVPEVADKFCARAAQKGG